MSQFTKDDKKTKAKEREKEQDQKARDGTPPASEAAQAQGQTSTAQSDPPQNVAKEDLKTPQAPAPSTDSQPRITEQVGSPNPPPAESAIIAQLTKALQDMTKALSEERAQREASTSRLEEMIRKAGENKQNGNGKKAANGNGATNGGSSTQEQLRASQAPPPAATADDFRTLGQGGSPDADTFSPTHTALGRSGPAQRRKRPSTSEIDALIGDDPRVKVTVDKNVAARDRRPSPSLKLLLAKGFQKIEIQKNTLQDGSLDGNLALDYLARPRGYTVGICQYCVDGIRPISEPHWCSSEFAVKVPLPDGEEKVSDFGVCIGINERGQAATTYLHMASGVEVWPWGPLVPESLFDKAGVVILGPSISADSHMTEAARNLNSYFRHLFSNTAGSDAEEIIPAVLDWEPLLVKYDMRAMTAGRKRQPLNAEIGLEDVADFPTQVATTPQHVIRALAAFGGEAPRVSGQPVGLLITSNESGALVITPVKDTDKKTRQVTTLSSDHIPVGGELKIAPLPASALPDAESIKQFEEAMKGTEPVADEEVDSLAEALGLKQPKNAPERDSDGDPIAVERDDWEEDDGLSDDDAGEDDDGDDDGT